MVGLGGKGEVYVGEWVDGIGGMKCDGGGSGGWEDGLVGLVVEGEEWSEGEMMDLE